MLQMIKPLLLTLLVVSSSKCFAQAPASEKKVFIDSAGNYYQQASLPVYLFVATSPGAKPVQLKSTGGSEIKMEGHGVHTFRHMNVLTKSYDEFIVYADGIAPISLPSFDGAPTHAAAGRYYFGKGLSIALTARDEMSGVENIYHAINNDPYEIYQLSAFNKEGEFTYRHYAVDRTGNAEAVKAHNFIVDLSAPKTYHHIVGISSQQVISTNSSIFLEIVDSLSGVAKTFYKFDKENFKLYPGGNIPFQYLPDGNHTLTYFSTDHVLNKEVEKSITFYLDKTAPIMSADVLGDKFLVGERVYFSGRTKLKLTGVDNKSGIKEMMYSINDLPFVKYADPFYLPNRSGIHNVKFYAIDQTNNKVKDDFEHSVGVIYVDLTGPTLEHQFIGPNFVKGDTLLVSRKTQIKLSGSDPESGLKKITYQIDKDATENNYVGKLISLNGTGLQYLTYAGYDNVNNRNSKSVFYYIDADGPEIHSQFAVAPGKEGKYASYTTVFLSATDDIVGAGEIRYTINGSKEQTYTAPLKGFSKNKTYLVHIKAIDLLGNVSEQDLTFKTDRY
jgi:hypothetical protein